MKNMEYTFVIGVTLGLLVVLVRAHMEARFDDTIPPPTEYNNQRDECVHEPNTKGTCLVMGVQHPYESLVYDGERNKFMIPFVVRDEEFNFALKKCCFEYITNIEVINNMEPSDRGFVTLTKGGVGQRDLTLLLQSQRGVGYDFTIRIYANMLQQHVDDQGEQSIQVKKPYQQHVDDQGEQSIQVKRPYQQHVDDQGEQSIQVKKPYQQHVDDQGEQSIQVKKPYQPYDYPGGEYEPYTPPSGKYPPVKRPVKDRHPNPQMDEGLDQYSDVKQSETDSSLLENIV